MTVDLETRFLFVVPLAEVSEVGEWEKEREGEETVGRQGGVVVSLAILSRFCPARLREGDVISSVSLGTHTEVATMVMLASYERSQHCAGILT